MNIDSGELASWKGSAGAGAIFSLGCSIRRFIFLAPVPEHSQSLTESGSDGSAVSPDARLGANKTVRHSVHLSIVIYTV